MKKLTLPKRVSLKAIIFLLLTLTTISVFADNGKISVEDYIAQYKFVAVEEMRNTGIPASITLAQAILESRYGNSELAKSANNHFGIKCHDWSGDVMHRDDDSPNECFRKYRSSYESYIDHSRFLERPRYSTLFAIATTDYHSWAKGLQNAGYATDPNYANQLINLVEKHQLFRFDEPIIQNTTIVAKNNQPSPIESTRQFQASVGTENATQYSTPVTFTDKQVYNSSRRVKRTEPFYYNKIKTVVLNENATAKQIANIYNIDAHKVCRYNDVKPNEIIPANTKVYLQPKRNKSANSKIMHTVKEGQSMERISQYYGIKLRKLYKRNKMGKGTQPAIGQTVYLKGKADHAPVLATNVNYTQQQEIVTQRNKVVINGSYTNSVNNTYSSGKTTSVNANESYDYYRNKSTANPNTNSNSYNDYKQSSNNTATSTNNSVNENDKVEVYYSSKPKTNTKTYAIEPTNSTKPVKNYTQVKTTSPYSGSISTTTDANYYATASKTYEPVKTTTTYTTTSLPKQRKVHVVIKGDTLYNISKRYNTTVEEIKALNNLFDNIIKLGQRLDLVTNTK